MGEFEGERPWWLWLVALLLIAGVIFAILRLFVLGRERPSVPVSPPTIKETPTIEETPTEQALPTATPILTPRPTVSEMPRTGVED